MPLFGACVGVGFGVFVRCWANALGRQRLLFRPWNHVLVGGIGGYLGYHYMAWEDGMLAEVNRLRAERGMVEIKRDNLFDFGRIN